ncbi:MAG TPA: glycosyltransferase family 4 protein [Acidimicrobiales bacterium]
MIGTSSEGGRAHDELSAAPADLTTTGLGVNAIASLSSTTGLSEAARRTISALLAAGIKVSLEDYDYGAPREANRFPPSFSFLPTGRPFDIDLCFLNINEIALVPEKYLRATRPRYVIGSWFWELPAVPGRFQSQIRRVDEIWTASRFVRDVFQHYTDRPVRVLPCVVEPSLDASRTRRDFGIPAGAVVCLFSFDANSTLARKNPRAVIEAFRRAVPRAARGDSAILVMKSINLHNYPEARHFLEHDLASVGGVFIDDDLTPGEMGALVAMSDIYVSLHRSEGFGLGMAEAMYFGKAVIGTAYSGNTDFMSAANSCPIGYRLVEVSPAELRLNPGAENVYEYGQLWAEPDIDEASTRLRFLIANPEARKRIGARARRTIVERYGASTVGRTMSEVLREGNILRLPEVSAAT